MDTRPTSKDTSDDEYEVLEEKTEFGFVDVEKEDIDPKEYKKYDNVGHRILTPDYIPKELDQAIFRMYSERYTFEESCEYKSFGFAYHLFKDKSQNTTIVLFNTVANNKENRENLISLDEALQFYKSNQSHHSTDKVKVMIPIGEVLYRKHFRLLTLIDHHFRYYDSKSLLISEFMHYVHPLYPATGAAFKEIQKRVKDQKNETVFGYIQQFGVFAREAIYNYLAYFDQVKQVCNKHFPQTPVERYALGHQPYDQHTDCGLYTIFYAIKIAQGLAPDDIKEEMAAFFASLSRSNPETPEPEPQVTFYQPGITVR